MPGADFGRTQRQRADGEEERGTRAEELKGDSVTSVVRENPGAGAGAVEKENRGQPR